MNDDEEFEFDEHDLREIEADEAVEQSLIDQAETVMRRFEDIEWPEKITIYPVEVISIKETQP